MICSVNECAKLTKCRGLCSAHYEYQRRHSGRLAPVARVCLECDAAFTSKAHNTTHCSRTCFLKSNRRQRKYGMTRVTFDALLATQQGKCGICRGDRPGGPHDTWSIDHDHETGAVRGILCSDCNTGLGLFRDNPSNLERARDYIFNAVAKGGKRAWWSAA